MTGLHITIIMEDLVCDAIIFFKLSSECTRKILKDKPANTFEKPIFFKKHIYTLIIDLLLICGMIVTLNYISFAVGEHVQAVCFLNHYFI